MHLLQRTGVRSCRLTAQLLRWRHAGSSKSAAGGSHYEVLGVEHDASAEVIKRAFIDMSKRLHPDHNPSRPDLHRRFVIAAEAYHVLSRPALRRQYDDTLSGRSEAVRDADRGTYSGRGSRPATRPPSSSRSSAAAEDEPFNWRDESLHAMRDKSKDKDRYYASDRFYGIQGVARMSNHVVALVLLAAGLLGSMTIFFISAQANRWQQERLGELQRFNGQVYQDVRRRAL